MAKDGSSPDKKCRFVELVRTKLSKSPVIYSDGIQYNLSVPADMTAGEFKRETGLPIEAYVFVGEWDDERYLVRHLEPEEKIPNPPQCIGVTINERIDEEHARVRRALQNYLSSKS